MLRVCRYTWCKRGCLQYVIIRPITTFTAVLAQVNNVLCPGTALPFLQSFFVTFQSGTTDPRFGYIWINFINLASVTVAMYTLVLVYVITSEKLLPFSPIPKFWAIKSIIFLSFWQQIIVVAMQKAGALDRFETQCVSSTVLTMNICNTLVRYFTADNIADGIQNVCICVEMVCLAWFSYKKNVTLLGVLLYRAHLCLPIPSIRHLLLQVPYSSSCHHQVLWQPRRRRVLLPLRPQSHRSVARLCGVCQAEVSGGNEQTSYILLRHLTSYDAGENAAVASRRSPAAQR
jgi:hypothetical protein